MSKLLFPSLCLSLTIWLFGGSIWFGNYYSQNSNSIHWELRDGNTIFQSPTLFSFQIADTEIILDDHQIAMVNQIADYLIENPQRDLILTGVYVESEFKLSGIKNIGLERAESFRQLFYRKGIDLERIAISGKLIEEHELNANGLIHGGVDFSFNESPTVKYGAEFKKTKAITFVDQSDAISNPKEFDIYVAAVRQYLTDHPEHFLKITGYCQSEDQRTLSQKRIIGLKNTLKKNGIDAERIEADMSPDEILNSDKNFIEIKIQ